MITVESISKIYSGRSAVEGLSFTVPDGQITGLLGPNGAGKTSTIRMIMDIIKPDSGRIQIGSPDRRTPPEAPGYLPEERGIYQKSRVLETLSYFASLRRPHETKHREELLHWLERFGLKERAEDRIASLSKGNQQKLQLIIALLSRSGHLILDEPFTGLDPANQVLVRDFLAEQKEKKTAILLSTHQMDIAEKLCDRIVLLNEGRLLAEDSLTALRETHSDGTLEFKLSRIRRNPPEHLLLDQVFKGDSLSGQLPKDRTLHEIIKEISVFADLESFQKKSRSLEDIFLKLTGDSEQ